MGLMANEPKQKDTRVRPNVSSKHPKLKALAKAKGWTVSEAAAYLINEGLKQDYAK